MRDLSKLVVAQHGGLYSTGDPFEPFQLRDTTGTVVEAVSVYLRELQACGRPATTQRSYAMDLLRFFRFLWALGVPWNEATRAEARDFARGSSSLTSRRFRPSGTVSGRRQADPAMARAGRVPQTR